MDRCHPRMFRLAMQILVPSLAGLILFTRPGAFAQSAEEEAQKEGAREARTEESLPETEPPRYRYDGYFSLRYVVRRAENASASLTRREDDEDLFSRLRLDVTMPREKRYEFHFLGAFRRDLDGDRARADYFPLEDIGDVGDSADRAFIYEAHFDFNDPFTAPSQLRLGRQAGNRGEPVFFDGIAAEMALGAPLNLTLYGGEAVRFFDLPGEGEENDLWGAGLDILPHRFTKVSLDILAVQDLREPGGSETDRLVSVRWRQRYTAHWRMQVRARGINGEARDVRVRSLSAFPQAAVDVNVTYFRQLRTQNELANEFSLYFGILGQSHPFQSLDLKVRWMPGEDYALDIGLFRRELLDPADEGPFNRDFSRTFLVFEVSDLLVQGVFTAVTAERWDAAEQSVESSGLDLGYEYRSGKKRGRIVLGTYYSLYKYDYYILLGERSRVRTYYLDLKIPLGASFSLTGGYEQEKIGHDSDPDAVEKFRTAQLGMRYDF